MLESSGVVWSGQFESFGSPAYIMQSALAIRLVMIWILIGSQVMGIVSLFISNARCSSAPYIVWP
jgi:hypothetical protein